MVVHCFHLVPTTKENVYVLLSIVVALKSLFCYATSIELILPPTSLLVPVNNEAAFICQANCAVQCSIQWFITNANYSGSTSNAIQRTRLRNHGLHVSFDPVYNNTYTQRLFINATTDNNNTRLYCFVSINVPNGNFIRSNEVTLTVIGNYYKINNYYRNDPYSG